jgi:tRNA(Ile)-lysidine synthase
MGGSLSRLTMSTEESPTVAVAFSGGRDSLALLHATCRSAAALGLQVVALHVHHGLQPEADDWVLWAQRLCARWRRCGWPLRLRWVRLSGAPAPGDSLEAWARNGRYEALARLAKEEGADLVLLAQHRRDQAETVMLQLLRGAGPAGLSAMPLLAQGRGLGWARPWLNQPRQAVEAYLQRHRLRPLEDPSNSDVRLARNRLRLQVWPVLLAAFGDAEVVLAAAAQRAQQASAALAELAALDLAPRVDDQGRLEVGSWRQLSPARQSNALRGWWSSQSERGLPDALLQRLLVEVPAAGAARWPAGRGLSCVLYRGRLQCLDSAAPAQAHGHPAPVWLDLSRPGRWPVMGWGGCIEVSLGGADGAKPDLLRAVQVQSRQGGERFQRSRHGLPRSLKKQYQSAGVPAHARVGPLLWSAGALLFAPGLGTDARCQACEGELGLLLRWCPDSVLSVRPQQTG